MKSVFLCLLNICLNTFLQCWHSKIVCKYMFYEIILLNRLIWDVNYSYSWMRKLQEAGEFRRKEVKIGLHLSADNKKKPSLLRTGISQMNN